MIKRDNLLSYFQLDKLIERTEHEYMESELPSDLNRAESMLEEHKRKKQEISHLINYTADEGEKIVVRVRQTVCTRISVPCHIVIILDAR